ncbi:hypothetical protein IX317_000575 [Fusobacterium sp. DD29]|nr:MULTISPECIES: oligosaccharide flippase family protein [unclassified Fusobacterium]MBR8710777.1 hypothetical protein [Fusobacterium sp. DD28]MBR8761184.1 hypothetical protein [Fusobacterium sp. DD25]MBR8767196.1 hypothetical protein [Fusobacterium sp. DD43]MBR8771246.1 hypothetical protein [Fusobacterium sp. DD40]MBR8775469.1 hypothetical protein [Fusobacterium sp. DD17]MBR8797734.1 hypothetical protein [Fusobacterium sp. DD12]MBR8813587.1 hypothetical protein [Fusobacterium sp. DD6]MBR88
MVKTFKNFITSFMSKYRALPITFKVSIGYFLCIVLQKIANLVTLPLFTRWLSPEDYGKLSLYISWKTIFVIFCTLNLYSGTYNAGFNKFNEKKNEFTSAIQGLLITLSIIFIFIYLIFNNFITRVIGLPFLIMLSMFIEILGSSLVLLWNARQRFAYKYISILVITILVYLFTPLVTIFLMGISKNKLITRIVVQAILTLIFVLPFAKRIHIKNFFYNKTYWKFALFFSIPLIPHYLSQIILTQSDRIMIDKLCNRTDVAIYSAGYTIGLIANLLVTSVGQVYGPWLFKVLRIKDYKKVKTASNVILIGGMFCIILLVLLAPEYIQFILPPNYHQVIYIIPAVAVSTYYQLIYNLVSNVEFFYLKNKFILISSMIAATLNVILNLIFIPKYGFIAAGYTTLVSYFFYGISHFIFVMKICDAEINTQLYDKFFFILTSMIMILFSVIAVILYDYLYLRYFVISLILGISLLEVYKNKEIIFRILNKNKEEK